MSLEFKRKVREGDKDLRVIHRENKLPRFPTRQVARRLQNGICTLSAVRANHSRALEMLSYFSLALRALCRMALGK